MGERLGKYELVSMIATGGMAEIHVAKASTLGVDKVVVIKRLLPQHLTKPDFVEMFLDEARIAAALNHPNIVQLHDFGPVDGAYFMAMEYLHGADLRSIHRHALAHRELVPLEHVLTIVTGVCSGLHHAHDARDLEGTPLDIVHRDVSPHNVVVTFDGAVKLVDFGIAKAKSRMSQTRHGTIKGKVPYMSPEQLRSEGLDRRADVYSLGVILYELTTGQRPYVVANTTEFALMMAIARGQIRPPSQVRHDYPPALEAIVMKATARLPADRYQTARELELALEAFAYANDLPINANSLAAYMATEFSERVARWTKARADGKALAEHVAEVELEPVHTDAEESAESEVIDTTNMTFQVEWDEAAPMPPSSVSSVSSLTGFAGVDITARQVGPVEVVVLTGRLTESFTGATVGAAMRGVVVIDLAGIERVTSFGVREWLEMMRAARSGVRELHLARLSESIATQMSMIRAFAGPAKVVSFFAPYLCDACGSTFRWLIDCERDAEAIRSKTLHAGTCPTCNSTGHFDDDEAYFAFALPFAGAVVPEQVRAALDALAEGDGPTALDAVEKIVVGDVTRLRIRGVIDRSVRWNRVLDGLEGSVVVDFQSPKLEDPEGLASALASLETEVTSLELSACPLAVLEALGTASRSKTIRVGTVSLEGTCPTCAAGRGALVDYADLESSIRTGSAIHAACRRCNAPLTFGPEITGRLRRVLASVPPPPKPRASLAQISTGKPRNRRVYIQAGAALAVVLAISVAVVVRSADSRPRPVDGAIASASASAALPAWASVPIVHDGTNVILVGSSGLVATEREGLELAQADAVRRLAGVVLTSLPDGPVKAFATSHLPDENAVLEPAAVRGVADRFLRIAGSTSTPERIAVVFTHAGDRMEAHARYSLSEEGLRSAVANYSRVVKLSGATLANDFPLATTPAGAEHEVVVVALEPSARAHGLAVGDRVTFVDDRPVANLQSFAALTRKSKTYTLRLDSDGTSKSVQLAR